MYMQQPWAPQKTKGPTGSVTGRGGGARWAGSAGPDRDPYRGDKDPAALGLGDSGRSRDHPPPRSRHGSKMSDSSPSQRLRGPRCAKVTKEQWQCAGDTSNLCSSESQFPAHWTSRATKPFSGAAVICDRSLPKARLCHLMQVS